MTPEQEHIVCSTWRHVYPVRVFVSELFYLVLFKVDPASRSALGIGPERREERFLEVLDALVGNLGSSGSNDPETRDERCASGVRILLASHRTAARIALLRVLHQALGERYTAAVEEAWSAALDSAAATFGASAPVPDSRERAARASGGADAAIPGATVVAQTQGRVPNSETHRGARPRPRYPRARRPSSLHAEILGTS